MNMAIYAAVTMASTNERKQQVMKGGVGGLHGIQNLS